MTKKTRFLVFSPAFIGVLLMLTVSCQKDEDVPATISDDNFYIGIGAALINCYVDIYNQNLAGMPTGSQNITSNGPMGGTVVITGTDSYDNTHGITTADLLFSMTEVKYIYSYPGSNNKTWRAEVILTGSTTYAGSFSNSYTSVNHQANNLHIVGSVTYDGTVRIIDMSGNVSLNRSSTTSANIFGHTVTW